MPIMPIITSPKRFRVAAATTLMGVFAHIYTAGKPLPTIGVGLILGSIPGVMSSINNNRVLPKTFCMLALMSASVFMAAYCSQSFETADIAGESVAALGWQALVEYGTREEENGRGHVAL